MLSRVVPSVILLVPVTTVMVPVNSKNIHNRYECEDASSDGRDDTEDLKKEG